MARKSVRASGCWFRMCFRLFDEVDPQLPPQQMLERAVESNVRWSMRQLLETPEGRARMAEGRMKLVGAVCEIATGRVRLLA
jgi:carbonic anhydrase